MRLAIACLLIPLAAHAALLDQVVAYYGFDESLANQLSDSLTGTASAGDPQPNWTGGNVTIGTNTSVRTQLITGSALNLVRDENDTVKLPIGRGPAAIASGSFNLEPSFTLSVWHFAAPVDHRSTNRYFVFEAEDNFDISWGTSSGGSYLAFIDTVAGPSATIASQQWYHVVYAVETTDTTSRLSLYLNGALIGTASALATNINFDRIVLGNARDSATPPRRFDGMLDEVVLWNRAVTSGEVARLHQLGRDGLRFAANLKYSAAPADAADLSAPAWLEHGSTAVVAVTVQPGFLFSAWNGARSDAPIDLQQILTNDLSVTAAFVPDGNDPDGDSLSNFEEERVYGTASLQADSDGDGLRDDLEIRTTGTDPRTSDQSRIAALQQRFNPTHLARLRVIDTRIASLEGRPFVLTGFEAAYATSSWQVVSLSAAQVTTNSDLIRMTLPAPLEGTDLYRLERSAP